MMTMTTLTRHALRILSLLVLLGLAPAAASQTLSWGASTATLPAGEQALLTLNYTGTFDPAKAITIDLPNNFGFAGISIPELGGVPTFNSDCGNVGSSEPWTSFCTLTLNPAHSGQSVSGNINLTVLPARFGFLGDDPTPVISADYDAGSVSAAIDVTVTAAGELERFPDGSGGQTGSFTPPGTSTPLYGTTIRIVHRLRNLGNASIRWPEITFDLPEDAWYIGTSFNDPSDPWMIVAEPTGTVKGGTVTLRWQSDLGQPGAVNSNGNLPNQAGNVLSSLTNYVYVDIFVSCEDLNDQYTEGGHVIPDNQLWPLTYVVTGSEERFGGAFVDHKPNPVTWGAPGNFPACTWGTTLVKDFWPSGPKTIGESFNWRINLGQNSGGFPVTDVVSVDALPPFIEFVEARVYDLPTFNTEFDIHVCRIPPLVGTLFTRADFLQPTALNGSTPFKDQPALCRDNGAYEAAVVGGSPPWPPAETTHVVAHDPSWVNAGGINGQTLKPWQYQIECRVAAGAPEVVYNLANEEGTNPDGSTNGPLQVQRSLSIDNSFNPGVGIRPAFGGDTFFPGSVATPTDIRFDLSFWRDGGGAFLQNPSIDVILPVGIAPRTGLYNNGFNYVMNYCTGHPDFADFVAPVWTLDDGGTAGDPLDDRWIGTADFDPISGDWFSLGCTPSASAYHSEIQVYTRVDPDYPYVTGDGNTVDVELTVDNAGSGVTSASDEVFFIMNSEMSVAVANDCGPSPANPAVTTTYQNTEGTHLSQVAITLPIPKVGAPTGTQVDTTFVSLSDPTEFTGGFTKRYSTDGGSGWSDFPVSGPAAAVTHVQVIIDQLDAYRGGDVVLTLAHAIPGVSGQEIHFAASLDAEGLDLVDNDNGNDPYTVGSCAATVTVTKFFDTDGDGVQGAGEDGLSGWHIEATAGGSPQSGTTGVDGTTTLALTPGTWTIEEVAPTDTTVSWFATSSGGESVDLVVGWDASYTLAFGNKCTCSDADECTADSCVSPGVCQSGPPPVCDTPAQCETGPGTCNAQSGECEYGGPDCTVTRYFATFEGPDGTLYSLGCAKVGASIICDTVNDDGVNLDLSTTLWCAE